VHVHAPFVRRFLPDARFVPVLLRWEAPRASLEQLATTLAAVLPADAVVVASVDFSHYQPEPWASFHDEAAQASVTSGDLDGLFNREVDSPEALYVARGPRSSVTPGGPFACCTRTPSGGARRS
jgi:AmmeMemoRadiSam system protein B